MTTLSSLLPPFLRRKRSAEEDEAHALRAALNAAGRATAVEKCLDLHAANKALAQRIGELERAVAARDDAAVRETVRDEVARIAPLPPPFCAAKDSKGSGLEGLLKSEAPSSNTPQPPQLAPPPNANHLLGLSPEELRSYCDDNNINSVAAISSHEPEIAAWRSDAPERKQSVRPDASKRVSVSFFNLRQAPIEVMWVDFDGNDKPLYTSTVRLLACVSRCCNSVSHVCSRRRPRPANACNTPRPHCISGACTTLLIARFWGQHILSCRSRGLLTAGRGGLSLHGSCAICSASTASSVRRCGMQPLRSTGLQRCGRRPRH